MARTLEQERAAIEKDVRKLEERRQRLEEKEREAAIQAIEKTGLLKLETKRLGNRSEEHTSELQSLMRISYAVFCLKKKNNTIQPQNSRISNVYYICARMNTQLRQQIQH